jgi:hypothetical protein
MIFPRKTLPDQSENCLFLAVHLWHWFVFKQLLCLQIEIHFKIHKIIRHGFFQSLHWIGQLSKQQLERNVFEFGVVGSAVCKLQNLVCFGIADDVLVSKDMFQIGFMKLIRYV